MTPPCPPSGSCPQVNRWNTVLPDSPQGNRCVESCELPREPSHTLPFFLDVPSADLFLGIFSPHLKNFKKEPVPLTGNLHIRDNHVLLQKQSLLQFHGLHVDFFLGSLHALQDLNVDASGQLNLVERKEDGHIETYPILKSFLANSIPRQWLKDETHLPPSFELNDLIDKIRQAVLEFQKEDEKFRFPDEKPATAGEIWQGLGKAFSPGTVFRLDLRYLQDFLLPGILDLGPTSAHVQLKWEAGNHLRGNLEDFQIQLDPMGMVRGGQIQSGTGRVNTLGDWIPPGIEILIIHPEKQVLLTANLDFEILIDTPQMGPVTLVGTLLGHFDLQPGRISQTPIPGTATLQIKDLQVDSKETPETLLSDVDILVTNNPRFWDPFAESNPNELDPVPIQIQVNGILPQHHVATATLQWISEWLEDSERTPALVKKWNLEMGDLQVFPFPIPRDWKMKIPLHPSKKDGGMKVENLQWKIQPLSAGEMWGFSLGVQSDRFQIGKLNLKKPELKFKLLGREQSPGKWRYQIPTLELNANPRGSGRGWVRGRLKIRQKGGPIEWTWDEKSRRFELNGLNMSVWAQGLHLLPKKLKTFLDPRVKSVGLDGRLRGRFSGTVAPSGNNWRGHGKISLRGDAKGDVYFLDARGRRVGPPLLRNTLWTWKRVRSLNRRGPYLVGDFQLETILNPRAFVTGPGIEVPEENPKPAYGLKGKPLRPYEISWRMRHDNQPWSAAGFKKKILDYVAHLCDRDPDCKSGRTQKGVRP